MSLPFLLQLSPAHFLRLVVSIASGLFSSLVHPNRKSLASVKVQLVSMFPYNYFITYHFPPESNPFRKSLLRWDTFDLRKLPNFPDSRDFRPNCTSRKSPLGCNFPCCRMHSRFRWIRPVDPIHSLGFRLQKKVLVGQFELLLTLG